MTRDEWIKQARILLTDNDAAAELLAAEIDPEVLEAEFVEKKERPEMGDQIAKITPVIIKVPAPAAPQRRGGARGGFMARFGKAVDAGLSAAEKAEDKPLSGFERLDVKTGELAEKAIDKGMDAISSIPEKMPTLRDRGSAWRGRRLGRGKPT